MLADFIVPFIPFNVTLNSFIFLCLTDLSVMCYDPVMVSKYGR